MAAWVVELSEATLRRHFLPQIRSFTWDLQVVATYSPALRRETTVLSHQEALDAEVTAAYLCVRLAQCVVQIQT